MPRELNSKTLGDVFEIVIARSHHLELLDKIRMGTKMITEDDLSSVTNPQWKLELVKAICLRKVGG